MHCIICLKSIFLQKNGRLEETLPSEIDLARVASFQITDNKKINVFTDLEAVANHLSIDKYNLVDDMDTADIIFVRKHFKDFK